jgi:Recombinase
MLWIVLRILGGAQMTKTERIREAFDRPLDLSYLRERESAGWRLVGLEWEREIEGDDARRPRPLQETPFGSQVSRDCDHLEENAPEMQFLFSMMELIVQDISLTKVAEELNKKGFRTRKGTEWGPVAVFNMLPRLIEVTPRILGSEEWVERRKRLSLVY